MAGKDHNASLAPGKGEREGRAGERAQTGPYFSERVSARPAGVPELKCCLLEAAGSRGWAALCPHCHNLPLAGSSPGEVCDLTPNRQVGL